MSRLQYRHIDLDGSSLVQRRFKRQVVPPGMWAVDNMFLSRSDNNPTLRPDFKQYDDAIYAVSDAAILQESGGVPDIVNSVTALYGSDRLVYLTTYVPWTNISGVPSIASESYTTGTATASNGGMSVAFASLGSGIDLHHKAWRGCLLEINGDGNYYIVDKVTSSTPGSEEGTLNLIAPTEAGLKPHIPAIHTNFGRTTTATVPRSTRWRLLRTAHLSFMLLQTLLHRWV
jgi:hypothetical protein